MSSMLETHAIVNGIGQPRLYPGVHLELEQRIHEQRVRSAVLNRRHTLAGTKMRRSRLPCLLRVEGRAGWVAWYHRCIPALDGVALVSESWLLAGGQPVPGAGCRPQRV